MDLPTVRTARRGTALVATGDRVGPDRGMATLGRLRTPSLALSTVAAAALAIAASSAADSKPVTATGAVVTEPDAKIKMEFQRNGGEPSGVRVFKVKGLDFSCFDGDDPGEFKVRIERGFDVVRGLDANGKRVWNLFNKRDTVKTDDFGRVGLSVFGTTNRKANRVEGNIGISFGGGCSNAPVTGFDVFRLKAPR